MPKVSRRIRRGHQNFSKGGGRPKKCDTASTADAVEVDEYFDIDAIENYVDMVEEKDVCFEVTVDESILTTFTQS